MNESSSVAETVLRMAHDNGVVTVTKAAELLHVNRQRIWSLIKQGKLHATPNPLDRREHLIAVEELAELLGLMASAGRTSGSVAARGRDGIETALGDGWPAPLSDGIADNPSFQSEQHEEYLATHWHGE